MKTYTPEKRIKLGLPSREEAIHIVDHSHIEITMGNTVTVAQAGGSNIGTQCGNCRSQTATLTAGQNCQILGCV